MYRDCEIEAQIAALPKGPLLCERHLAAARVEVQCSKRRALKVRREKIATAVLAMLAPMEWAESGPEGAATTALEYADALIAALDKEP